MNSYKNNQAQIKKEKKKDMHFNVMHVIHAQ